MAAVRLARLFVERVLPPLVGRAVVAGAVCTQVQCLPSTSVADGLLPVPRWQDSAGIFP